MNYYFVSLVLKIYIYLHLCSECWHRCITMVAGTSSQKASQDRRILRARKPSSRNTFEHELKQKKANSRGAGDACDQTHKILSGDCLRAPQFPRLLQTLDTAWPNPHQLTFTAQTRCEHLELGMNDWRARKKWIGDYCINLGKEVLNSAILLSILCSIHESTLPLQLQ